MNPSATRLLGWLVTIFTVVALALLAVRIVLNPGYPAFEYRTPGFPADPFGFTPEERVKYSRIAVEYLLNDEDISFLGEQRFPAGEEVPPQSCRFMDDCNLMSNERELKHMVDVKNVVQAALKVFYSALIGLVLLGLWAWRGGWADAYLQGLSRGGWLTVALVGLIIVSVVAIFGVIFLWFHQIFFASGTWIFYWSDTLIRMFPERFWRDTFLWVGLLGTAAGVVTALVAGRLRKSRTLKSL